MRGPLFLGVDGGKSSTFALIGDEAGQVLGAGSAGPCNHVSSDQARESFVRAIHDALAMACAAAGLDAWNVHFEAACLGFSGGPEDKRELLEQMLSTDHLSVTHDALIALSGATAGQPGIITIAGTGSIAFGRNAGGRTARAGGWGYIFGDEGSAFDLVRQAARAALRFEEGWGPPTVLHDLLIQAAGAPSANRLLHLFYTPEFPRSRVASYAPLIDQAALAADGVARDLLQRAAQELASLTAAVRGQLFERGETVPVAYVGGVFRSRTVLERYRMLVELEDGNRCGPPLYGPAAGALIEAYRARSLHPPLKNLPGKEK